MDRPVKHRFICIKQPDKPVYKVILGRDSARFIIQELSRQLYDGNDSNKLQFIDSNIGHITFLVD